MKKLLRRFALWILDKQGSENIQSLLDRVGQVVGEGNDNFYLVSTRLDSKGGAKFSAYCQGYDFHTRDSFEEALEDLSKQINTTENKGIAKEIKR